MNDGVNFSQQQQEAQDAADFSQQACEANQEANRQVGVEFEYCLDDILASANFEPDPRAANASAAIATVAQKPSLQEAADALRDEPPADRRKRRRALISAPVRVRGINVTDAVVDEISTTIDVSRAGILFLSTSPNYARGMEVAVMFPYSNAPAALHAEQQGRIVRAFGTDDGRYAVAVALGEGIGEDIVDSCGRKIADSSPAPRMPLAPPAAQLASSNGSVFSLSREPNSKRPLVLVVDADEMIRATLKAYLGGEGYEVMAVGNCPDAREVMNMFTPALVIAEVEGDGLPGYDLCAHVKQSPRLKHIPGGVDDELRLPERLLERAFARRGGLHDEALQTGAARARGAFARAAARGILRAEEWRDCAASGRSEPPLRLRERRREWQQRCEWQWRERRSEARCQRRKRAEAPEIPLVPVVQ